MASDGLPHQASATRAPLPSSAATLSLHASGSARPLWQAIPHSALHSRRASIPEPTSLPHCSRATLAGGRAALIDSTSCLITGLALLARLRWMRCAWLHARGCMRVVACAWLHADDCMLMLMIASLIRCSLPSSPSCLDRPRHRPRTSQRPHARPAAAAPTGLTMSASALD